MSSRPVSQRLLVLAEGQLGVFSSKTTTSLLRYRADDCVAVLDSENAGKTTDTVLGVHARVPIVATLSEGLSFRPEGLVIGIAPAGGQLPEAWRPLIADAIRSGLSVISGLHVFLSDDPEFAELALRHNVMLVDLRRPPEGQPIAHAEARTTRAVRVLTVGTDCNVGKMVAALELTASARRRDLDARFLATGQTGMLLTGGGITLDRIAGDFMAGFIEQLVLEAADADLAIVEGQGSLLHPAFSGVTAALIHGSLPDAMIMVHHAGRTEARNQPLMIPPVSEWVRRYDDFLAPLHPGKVVGIAINPYGLTETDTREAIHRAEDETGLPAVDVVTEGADRLLDAVLANGKP